jgi:NitT/TauT family transport system ATP-binding protein
MARQPSRSGAVRSAPAEADPGSIAAPSIISVTDVTKTFKPRSGVAIRALGPISLELRPKEFLAVLGPSGCGKSTLLMLVAGLIPPTSGQIRLWGKPVRGPSKDLGVVFQQDLLMEWRRTLGNILIQGEFRRMRKEPLEKYARELLAMVGLSGFEDKYPHELSGGMRQRVAICRALVHDPSLLLMDEPFGALDAITRDQMNEELQRIWQHTGKSVLFITHSIPEAIFLADRVLVVGTRPGRIVDDVAIDIPRPRTRATKETQEFATLTRRIRKVLEETGVFQDRGA